MQQFMVQQLFDLDKTEAGDFLKQFEYPWQALPKIGAYIKKLGATLSKEDYIQKEEGVWIAKSAKIAPTALIQGPCIIGERAEVRHCAYIRGNVLVGSGCVVGNSTELKNVILFQEVQVPHYNYVGDSILGYHAHMGAGAITSNVKADKSLVEIVLSEERYETGLKKFGAILGDYAEIGCNSVLNPGTLVGKNSNVYPLSMVRGVVPEKSIYKKKGEIVEKKIHNKSSFS